MPTAENDRDTALEDLNGYLCAEAGRLLLDCASEALEKARELLGPESFECFETEEDWDLLLLAARILDGLDRWAAEQAMPGGLPLDELLRDTMNGDSMKPIRRFLDDLKSLFDQILQDSRRMYPLNGACVSRFGRYVCRERIGQALPNTDFSGVNFDDETGLDLHGFVAWLLCDSVVGPDGQDRRIFHVAVRRDHVVRDFPGSLDLAEGLGLRTWERRLEHIVLHEIGHARIHPELYVSAGPGHPAVFSSPLNESRAWTYADTISGTIRSVRSRLCRYLYNVEQEFC
ncbi:MAG: hypothetical protein HN742_43250 [Lentisphaerae bacterium]|jgi:hypothetical protein|nr:hypothetical protein [Lentisphaerota bacterium]MBT4815225.1 hypothetical protein [Lentisphaerota bacterium]MBT5606069.1 hypothetical protein [Lentisphaerota bacterium]MBT7060302.1 hypothetical protein [Lentisphaerota bacterium]MBT7848756.1 hypothetical protein [Lentisphaerota bacterium]